MRRHICPGTTHARSPRLLLVRSRLSCSWLLDPTGAPIVFWRLLIACALLVRKRKGHLSTRWVVVHRRLQRRESGKCPGMYVSSRCKGEPACFVEANLAFSDILRHRQTFGNVSGFESRAIAGLIACGASQPVGLRCHTFGTGRTGGPLWAQ